jgi:hypothetical protein
MKRMHTNEKRREVGREKKEREVVKRERSRQQQKGHTKGKKMMEGVGRPWTLEAACTQLK